MADGAPGVAPVPAVAEAAWMPVAPDWRRLYWEARERTEAAAERADELKRAELDARCDAGSRRLPQDREASDQKPSASGNPRMLQFSR